MDAHYNMRPRSQALDELPPGQQVSVTIEYLEQWSAAQSHNHFLPRGWTPWNNEMQPPSPDTHAGISGEEHWWGEGATLR